MSSKLIISVVIYSFLNLYLPSISGQTSNLDGNGFINQVRSDINFEISAAQGEFLYSAQLAQDAAKKYIALKLKENLFRELVQLEEKQKTKALDDEENVQRDDADEDEDEDGDDKESATNAPTAKPVILQTADLLKVIFGPAGGVNGLVKGIGGGKGRDLDLRPIENTEVERIVDELTAKSSLRISGHNSNIAKNPLITNQEEMYRALGSSFLQQMGYTVLKGQLPSDKNLFYGTRSAFLVNAILRDFINENALSFE